MSGMKPAFVAVAAILTALLVVLALAGPDHTGPPVFRE